MPALHDLWLRFEPSVPAEGAYRVRLEGAEKPLDSQELGGEPGLRCDAALVGEAIELLVCETPDAARARALGLELGRRLHPRIRDRLRSFAGVPFVRLLLDLRGISDLALLPWEALALPGDDELEQRRVVEASGWQVLRAQHPLRPGHRGDGVREVLAIVGDLAQDGTRVAAEHRADALLSELAGELAKRGVSLRVLVAKVEHERGLTGDRPGKGWAHDDVTGDADHLERWLREHGRRDALLLFLGHGVDEQPSPTDAIQSANALALGFGGGVAANVPLTRLKPGDERRTLGEMIEGTRVRAAVLLACNGREGLTGPLLSAVDHVVTMRRRIAPELAAECGVEIARALCEHASTGEAVRRARAALRDAGSGDFWALSHSAATAEDRPFADAATRALDELATAALAEHRDLEDDSPEWELALDRVAIDLQVDEEPCERPGARDAAGARAQAPGRDGEWWEAPGAPARAAPTLRDLLIEDTAEGPRVRLAPRRPGDAPGREHSEGIRLVLRGVPGGGKTTTLRTTARGELRNEAGGILPLVLSLSAYLTGPKRDPTPESVLEFLAADLALERRAAFAEAVQRRHDERRLVVLIDGLDEVAARVDEAVRLIQNLSRRWSKAAIAVTTRDDETYRNPDRESFTEARLLPLGTEKKRELVEQLYTVVLGDEREAARRAPADVAELERDEGSLRQLSSVPLLLSLMARRMAEDRAAPPALRHSFFEQMIEYLLAEKHKPPGRRRPLTDAQRGPALDALRGIALHLTEHGRLGLEQEALRRFLNDPAGPHREDVARLFGDGGAFLERLCSSGLLRPRSRSARAGEWIFWHRSFLEALASQALRAEHAALDVKRAGAGLVRLKERVAALAAGDAGALAAWREPLALLAGYLVDGAGPFVRALLGDDATRRIGLDAVALADALTLDVLRLALERCQDDGERVHFVEALGRRPASVAPVLALLREHLEAHAGRADLSAEVLLAIDDALARLGRRDPEHRTAAGGCRRLLFERFPHLTDAARRDLFSTVTARGKGGRAEDYPLWVEVEGRPFTMGSPEKEEERFPNEGPVEVAALPRFTIAAVPVTLAMYGCMHPGKRHRWGDHEDVPVTEVTWFEAELYARWLGRELFEGRLEGRLPTEAEWEYACRGGHVDQASTRFYSGDSEADLEDVAWWRGSKYSKGKIAPQPVAGKVPNKLGLFDMHGNAWEWCRDWYGEVLRPEEQPGGPPSGSSRLLRGGSFWFGARWCRSARRVGDVPGVGRGVGGFRVVLAPPSPSR